MTMISHTIYYYLLIISFHKTCHPKTGDEHTLASIASHFRLGLVYIPIQLLKTQMASTTGIDGTLASDEDEGQTIGSSQFGGADVRGCNTIDRFLHTSNSAGNSQ